MRTNHVKAKLAKGEPVLGSWVSLPSVTVARLMARLGFDWLLIDAEHSAHNPSLVADMIATIADAGTSAPFVRIPYHSIEWFKWALDAGAWGVLVPMVNTVEEAQQAVSWSKYPPAGTRSLGGAFAPYGFGTTDRMQYFQAANNEIMVMLQVESVQGLTNLDEILAVPGVDVAFVGPNDLHLQLGLPPSTEGAEPAFTAALERVKAIAHTHHTATGIFCSTGEAAAQRIREGFQMVNVTSDIASLTAAASQHLKTALR
ncbi:MAG TPA: aldolase/citrate lyase family protein [Ktedonosporobacter sp.]|nr:aldolase/citrate lyase family protein [Ktedonosporobacter sp.]